MSIELPSEWFAVKPVTIKNNSLAWHEALPLYPLLSGITTPEELGRLFSHNNVYNEQLLRIFTTVNGVSHVLKHDPHCFILDICYRIIAEFHPAWLTQMLDMPASFDPSWCSAICGGVDKTLVKTCIAMLGCDEASTLTEARSDLRRFFTHSDTSSIEVKTIPLGMCLYRLSYSEGSSTQGEDHGYYFTPYQNSLRHLGVSMYFTNKDGVKQKKRIICYEVQITTDVLSAHCSDTIDTWSMPGQSIVAPGGGTQVFIPHHMRQPNILKMIPNVPIYITTELWIRHNHINTPGWDNVNAVYGDVELYQE